jgi:hypothetical protein
MSLWSRSSLRLLRDSSIIFKQCCRHCGYDHIQPSGSGSELFFSLSLFDNTRYDIMFVIKQYSLLHNTISTALHSERKRCLPIVLFFFFSISPSSYLLLKILFVPSSYHFAIFFLPVSHHHLLVILCY